MLLNTRHIADLLNISGSTVKKYSSIYSRFLSETARPQDGAHRLFDTEDVRILAYVVQQYKLGARHEDILVSVANGARADVPMDYGNYSVSVNKDSQILLLENRIMQLEAQVLELSQERERRIRAEAERDLMRDLLREWRGKG